MGGAGGAVLAGHGRGVGPGRDDRDAVSAVRRWDEDQRGDGDGDGDGREAEGKVEVEGGEGVDEGVGA